jgi:putative membrane protein
MPGISKNSFGDDTASLMRKISKSTEILLWVYGVGLAGMLVPFTHGVFTAIVPLNLIFAVVFLFFRMKPERRVVITGAFIMISTFFIEAAGVRTGIIFGSYSYGKTLGPALWDTPVIIGLNWFVLIYCTNAVARLLWTHIASHGRVAEAKMTRWIFIIISGSFLMVIYDLLLEPAAIRLDMWSWAGGVIPIRNFLAWLVISAVYQVIMKVTGEDKLNRRAMPLFVVQLVFFAVIDLYYAFF